jgi:hypothetical protein
MTPKKGGGQNLNSKSLKRAAKHDGALATGKLIMKTG